MLVRQRMKELTIEDSSDSATNNTSTSALNEHFSYTGSNPADVVDVVPTRAKTKRCKAKTKREASDHAAARIQKVFRVFMAR